MALTDSRDDRNLSAALTAPFAAITDPAWWHRHLDPEERRRVMNELAMTPVEHWGWRFTVMLTLSVVVAVMGLSANSAAVVIGAMLLAPLMTPVLATAASLSMSLWPKAFVSLVRVVVATAWCIGLAYLLSMLLPNGPLPSEVQSRTQPDIRDLVVALAAGAAGSYATVRKDASAALPGVAVAVALVPPLGTIGITLEAGERDLAVGAMLLYTTNLAAIIFAGVMVFIATGFVPPRRLSNTGLQLLVAGVIAGAVVAVIAVPLFRSSAEAVAAVQDEVKARAVVDDWLDGRDLAPQVDVDDDQVLVELRGFEAPPDDAELKEALQRQLGEVTVVVEWVRIERATTTAPPVLSDEEVLLKDVERVVEAWLADNSVKADGADFALEHVSINDGQVRVDVAGPGNPPSVEELVERLQSELDAELPVRLNWTERETITPGASTTVPPIVLTEQEMRVIVDQWAAEAGLTLDTFRYDGESALVEVTGSTEPRIYQLTADLEDVAETEIRVDVLYTERRRVTTTVPPVDVFGALDGPPATTTTTTG
ncbi:MAG: DUF389 domain-containing protein [Actinomycetota bacterium]